MHARIPGIDKEYAIEIEAGTPEGTFHLLTGGTKLAPPEWVDVRDEGSRTVIRTSAIAELTLTMEPDEA